MYIEAAGLSLDVKKTHLSPYSLLFAGMREVGWLIRNSIIRSRAAIVFPPRRNNSGLDVAYDSALVNSSSLVFLASV